MLFLFGPKGLTEIKTTTEYTQAYAILDAAYKSKVISFSEWYECLLDIRERYGMMVAR
jgi:hypothetical protein